MSRLLDRLSAAAKALTGRAILPALAETSLPNGVLEFMSRHGKVPDVSQQALVQKYHGWVYACASISANKFASTPLRLYAARGKGQPSVKHFDCRPVDRDRERWIRSRVGKSLDYVAGAEDFEELTEHPLLELLSKVNDVDNGFETKELTCTMLDLTGNCYWLLERDKLGVPSQLFLLRSQWVRVIPDKQKFVRGYWYGYNNAWGVDERLELDVEDVIHFKYPNPLDPWYGMSPVQAAAYAVEDQDMRDRFILATMSNMARPDLIVKYTEGELDPKERAAVEREWNAMFRGAKNAGRVKVTDFRYELEKVGWSPSELDFNRGEDWVMKKIASAFPVPVGLLDTTSVSRAPRSGMEGVDMFLGQYNTLPRCTRFEEKLNERLCPMYDERLFVAFDNPVAKDKTFELQEDNARLQTQQVTINEVRKRRGEEPVEWGDLPLVGPGIAPLGSQQASPEQATEPEQPGLPGQSGSLPGGAVPGTAAESAKKPAKKPEGMPEESEGKPGEEAEVKKAFAEGGLTAEVDGGYVHPTLAGVPVRLRVRNEFGRFDRRDPDKFRAGRDVVESLRTKGDTLHGRSVIFVKGESKDEGRWVTMRGQPVFIREGQSAEDAVAERFGKRSSGEGGLAGRHSLHDAGKRPLERTNQGHVVRSEDKKITVHIRKKDDDSFSVTHFEGDKEHTSSAPSLEAAHNEANRIISDIRRHGEGAERGRASEEEQRGWERARARLSVESQRTKVEEA